MTMRRTAHTAGFTLLEVLIALTILSLAVVAAIQGFAQGLRLLKLAGDHQQAMLLADRKAREIIDPTQEPEHATDSEGDFRWERTTRQLDAPDLVPEGTTPRWRVYEIAVSVQWDESRHVDVTTLRTVPVTATGAAATQAPAAQTPAVQTPGGGAAGTTATPGAVAPTFKRTVPSVSGRTPATR